MVQTFDFKPALLAKRSKLTVSEQDICCETAGKQVCIALKDVRLARFWSMVAERHHFVGLELRDQSGASIDLRMTFAEFSDAGDPDRRAFREMLATCLDALHKAQPGLQVELGQKVWVRWTLFVMGLLTVGAAGLIIFLAMADGRSSRLGQALMPLTVMMLMGIGLVWNFHPFSRPDYLESHGLAELLRLA